MRVALVLLALGLTSSQVGAQTYPAEMPITVAEVEVRSGPTKEYYATSKLRYGDRVLVLRESKDQPGWLAIRPPSGSFSWINARHVKQAKGDPHTGYVETEGNVAVPVRPGSALINRAPDVESVKIQPGTLITILEKPVTADGVTWLPIMPPPSEVRFIPAEAVRPQQVAGNNPNAGGTKTAPVAGTPWTLQAEPVSRQLPGHPDKMAQGNPPPPTIGQTTAFSRTPATTSPQVITYPAQWSTYGVLRRAAFEKDGLPMYVLETGRGQVLMYVTSASGTSLRDYVGRTVALYGSITYRSDDAIRTHFMTATHLAVP